MFMNIAINEAQSYIEKIRAEYIQKHSFQQERDELIAENNIEKRDVKGYHGREILELLQNADDAYQKSIDEGSKPECELVVTIKYYENKLTVINTGTAFDRDGIKAIVQGNNSPKTGKYIGNKGTGFRSVLNWAKAVRVFSGEYSIEFSEKIANNEFEKVKSLPQIQKQLKKKQNLYFPMLALPEWISGKGYNSSTTIEIDIDPLKIKDNYSVEKQIDNIDLRILLFLPNISQIKIDTDKDSVIYKRTISYGDMPTVILQKIVGDNIELEEQFYLFNKKIIKSVKEDDTWKDILLSIAVPCEFKLFNRSNLYSFFPLLDTDSPFNCVMHASYALGDHRNTINANETNKKIIQEQIIFLFEIVRFFVNKKQYDIAYQLLVPINFQKSNWRFLAPFSKFELENFYFDLLASEKIFLSVNDVLLSIDDGLKIIGDSFPDFFKGDAFAALLKPLEDNQVLSLIEAVGEKRNCEIYYFEDELAEIIDSVTDTWSIEQQVKTFVWWNNYGFCDFLPKLMKKQNNQWLTLKEECFFLVGNFEKTDLPDWVKIPALDKDYQTIFLKVVEETESFIAIRENSEEKRTERIVCQQNLFPTVSFKYRDMNNIISAVNSSVDTYNKAVDFIKWLWVNYGKKEDWNPPGLLENGGVKYNFPSILEKNVIESGKIYFPSEYGNDLASRLFDATYGAFPKMELFGIGENERQMFVEFVSKFGVKNYPVIELLEINNPLDSFCQGIKKEIKKNGDTGSSSTIYCKYKLPYIKDLQNVLEKLSTEEIVLWIYKDVALYSDLCNPYTTNADIKYQGNLQQYLRKYCGPVKNYVLTVFNETKWIDVKGCKYSPKQILKNFASKNNERFSSLVPTLNVEDLEKISKYNNIDFEAVYEIFSIFEFANKITDLSSSDFYGLLLALPNMEIEKSYELSKQIYRIIEQKAFTKDYEYSENKRRFFLKGKVLVRYQGQLQYWNAKEAVLPSTKIINKKNHPIIEKGFRTNNENFVRIFGCKEYSNEYKIIPESVVVSEANKQFQEYFSCFQKYARAYDESNENIEKYGSSIKITLISKIIVNENDILQEIDEEYACVRGSITNWYIIFKGVDFDINSVSEKIEDIYANIANTPGYDSNKIGELFRTQNKETREFLIMKEFGTLNVIEDSYYQNAIKTNFIKTINKLAPTFQTSELNIDFENFSKINNAPAIISLLRTINTDVENFKGAGFVYSIDLIPYYQKETEEFIFNEKDRFKNVLFSRALVNESLQEMFLKTVYKFENYNVFMDYRNSINFDIEQKFLDEFGEWRFDDFVLADKVYAENYIKMNPNRKFEDDLANDLNVKKMIYFKLVDEFNEWMVKKENQKQDDLNNRLDVDPYSLYRDIVPTLHDISYNGESTKKHSGKHVKKQTVYVESQVQKQKRRQKLLGNKGELLVYNYLCNMFGKSKVFTKSEAFVDLGLLTAGQASSGEYDISYIDKNGEHHFVEVKTGSKQSFIISPAELEFAEKHADNYELYIVYDVETEEPKFTKLPGKFWENEKFRRVDIVERIEFEF